MMHSDFDPFSFELIIPLQRFNRYWDLRLGKGMFRAYAKNLGMFITPSRVKPLRGTPALDFTGQDI